MSLINQALRKAQRDRAPRRADHSGSASGPGTPPRPPSALSGAGGFNVKLVIAIGFAFALLIGLVAGLTIVILNQSESPPPSAATSPSEPAISSLAEPPVAEPPLAAGPTDPVITPAPEADAVAPPVAADPGLSVVEELRLAREAAEADAARQAEEAARAAEAADPPAPAEPEANPAVIDWLAAARISGVRLSGDDSKVILNGKAFGLGEIVNYSLGLEVLVVQEKRVLFVDRNGVKYLKGL